MMADDGPQGIEAIVRVAAHADKAFIPPLSDYQKPSHGWTEVEYRCWNADNVDESTVGYWTGEPGEVSFDSWPYTEVCAILTGSVGLRDTTGQMMTFGARESFIVPNGWRGTWITIEPSSKIFVALR